MTQRSAASSVDASTALYDLPPSAKLVAKTLEYEGELTQGELAESTRLPPRTVRYGLANLEEADLVTSRISFMDARQRIYSLTTEEQE